MLPEADSVVRHFMPVALEAFGSQWAPEFHKIPPIRDESGMGAAACLIKAARSAPRVRPGAEAAASDLLLWAEAAVWAAVAGDAASFHLHVGRAKDALTRAAPALN